MKRVLLFVMLTIAVPVLAADNWVGTWKLNLAKSKYSPGPAPKSQTTKLEAAAGGVKEIGDRVNTDGSTTHWEVTAKFDGKEYPVKGDPDGDVAIIKKVDNNTLEVTNKKAGKVTTSMRIVVAPDGKSRTNVVTSDRVSNTLFFDRQ